VELLEEVIVSALAGFNIAAHTRNRHVGVWLNPSEKIASIGVKIDRRITSHGFSLNVDLSRAVNRYIVTCGMPEVKMVSMSRVLEACPPMHTVKRAVADSFSEAFSVNLEEIRASEWLIRYESR
jgi:lipoate-protein ligase B